MIGLFVGCKDTKCSTNKQTIAACFLTLGIDWGWFVDSLVMIEKWLRGIRLL
jgi:hypothetical protein